MKISPLAASALLCLVTYMHEAPTQPLLVDGEGTYCVGPAMRLYSKSVGNLSPQAVMADESNWTPTDQAEPAPGFSAPEYWARVTLLSARDKTLYLTYRYENVELCEFYARARDGSISRGASGTTVPYPARAEPCRYPTFRVKLEAGKPLECFVRIITANLSMFPLYVEDEAAHLAFDRDESALIGILIGLFLVIAIVDAYFFLATKDKAYLFYSLFLLSFLMFDMSRRDVTGLYLWPLATWLDDPSIAVSASLAMCFGLLFTRSFLRNEPSSRFFDRLILAALPFPALNAVASPFIPWPTEIAILNVLLFAVIAVFIAAGVDSLRRGYKPARFYALSWFFLLSGGIVFGLFLARAAPSSPFVRNSLSIGSAVQVLVLTVAIVDRIVQMKRDQERLHREKVEAVEDRLFFDPLTRLPNRNRLISELIRPEPVTLLLVNISRFKEVNDYFGQSVGDFLIKEIGGRVSLVMERLGGRAFRLHADEFAGLLEKDLTPDVSLSLAEWVAAECQDKPYEYEGETLRVEVSIGLSVASERHLEKADMALSESRFTKRSAIYSPEKAVIKSYADNFHWLHVIRKALEEDRVVPFFQPIAENPGGRVYKHESLMRILANSGEVIGPGAFLGIAKRSKLYPELSRAMLGKTVKAMKGNADEVSLNLSLEDILNPRVRGDITRALSDEDVSRRLIFEILESEGIENFAEVVRFIDEVKERGCRIAIDDFGTGYSNFEYVLKLKVDYVKIAAPLVKDIDADHESRTVTEAIAGFARKLGIKTIAEFVHKKAVQDAILEIGVDYSQGYFIGEPAPSMTPPIAASAGEAAAF